MKLSLLPLLAMTAAALPQEPTGLSSLQKRDVRATVLVDGLRHRTCPKTSCSAPGQYAKGTIITLKCYTRDDTTTVEGDKGWAKVSNGDWVAIAWMTYVTWSGSLPYCS